MKIVRKTAFLFAMSTLIVTQTGCFGEFALTRKAYNWHADIGSKFVRSLLLWIPMGIVYNFTVLVDVVILNLIEFWGGSNPLSMNEGDYEMQMAKIKGVDYKIEATKDTFTTTQLSGEMSGEVRVMKFDRTSMTWVYSDSKVCEQPVMGFLDAEGENVRVYTNFGTMDMAAADLQNEELLLAKFGECKGEAMASAN